MKCFTMLEWNWSIFLWPTQEKCQCVALYNPPVAKSIQSRKKESQIENFCNNFSSRICLLRYLPQLLFSIKRLLIFPRLKCNIILINLLIKKNVVWKSIKSQIFVWNSRKGGCIYDLSHFEWGYVVLQNGVLTARETSSCPVWTSHNLAVVSILPVATTELCGLKLRQTYNKKSHF